MSASPALLGGPRCASACRLLPLAVALALGSGTAFAGVVTDGSVGPRRGLNGPDYVIGASLGTIRGANLFHSFDLFSVAAGESATFRGPENIRHVVSRVTGGAPSQIDGLLRSEVGQADFYFINPAGVVIGPDAHIDVPASLHIATAHEVRFADGTTYPAIPSTAPAQLTTAAPEAFGFLDRPTGDVQWTGGEHLAMPGAALTLAGANVTLNGAYFSTPGAHLTLVATGGAGGTVGLGDGAIDIPAAGTLRVADSHLQADVAKASRSSGQILLQAGTAEVSDSNLWADNWTNLNSHGGVAIRAGDLTLDHAYLSSEVYGAGHGGDLDLGVGGTLVIRNRSQLSTFSKALGDAGDVTLDADSLTLRRSSLQSSGHVSGVGGSIVVDATEAVVRRSDVWADNYTDFAMDGGVRWSGDSLTLDGAYVSAESYGAGAGGEVVFELGEAFTARNSSRVQTVANSSGAAGRILVNAERIALRDGSLIKSSGLDKGPGGNVALAADELRITGQAAIEADGGAIDITSARWLFIANSKLVSNVSDISGSGGHIQIRSGAAVVRDAQVWADNYSPFDSSGGVVWSGESLWLNRAYVSSETYGSGAGGNLDIDMRRYLVIGDDSIVSTFSDGAGDAGDLGLAAGDLALRGGASINSSSHGDGAGGMIDVHADWAQIRFSTLEAIAEDSGDAGAILLDVDGPLRLRAARIDSSTARSGHGGAIEISAAELDAGRSAVTTTTHGRGNAGSSRILVSGDAKLNGSSVSSSTRGAGHAGGVRLQVGGALDVDRSTWVTSDTWGRGAGGDVQVSAGSATLSGRALITADSMYDTVAATGAAGSVWVDVAGRLVIEGGAYIASDSYGSGDGGSVEVTAGELTMRRWGAIYSEAMAAGDAGEIHVAVDDAARLRRGAYVSTSSYPDVSGAPGSVTLAAGEVRLTTGASIGSDSAGAADGGQVSVSTTGDLYAGSGGRISTSSGYFRGEARANQGDAGQVEVHAARLVLDGDGDDSTGILSRVSPRSLGEVGDVAIDATSIELLDQGRVSIENLNRHSAPGATNHQITVTGSDLRLDNGGRITAESRGAAPAGSIELHLDHRIDLVKSAITTAAADGDGGHILVDPWIVQLTDSQITTSVSGSSGNGGDITIEAGNLILDGGFIQANTAAIGARGGEILIGVTNLIPAAGLLRVGDLQRLRFQPGLNVIQAAAPDGVNGEIAISAPELDVTSGLVALDTGYTPSIDLYQGPCGATAGGSSLGWSGRGGLPWSAGEPYALPLDARRMQHILGTPIVEPATLPLEIRHECPDDGAPTRRRL